MSELNRLPTLPIYSELTAALERQRREYKKRNPKYKSKPTLNDLLSSLGILVGAIYRDQLALLTAETASTLTENEKPEAGE